LEYSEAFIKSSPIKNFIIKGDLDNLNQFNKGEFDLVVCMEVLEHLPPTRLDKIINGLKNITSKFLLITIPMYGPNNFGYAGLPINEEPWIIDARKNTPFKNLVVDENNIPDLGHISLATYKWWTLKFLKNGLIRDPVLENRGYINNNFLKFRWNLFVLKTLADEDVNLKDSNYFFTGIHDAENWEGKSGYIRWLEKNTSIYLKLTRNINLLGLKLYSGPRETMYDIKISIKLFLLQETPDLKLTFKMVNSTQYEFKPDNWYEIEINQVLNEEDVIKIQLIVSRDFIPQYLIFNNDQRRLAVALSGIRAL
jgi:hypothetical protein